MGAIDYDAWAKTYDATRGASPSVLGPIAEAMGLPAGRSLLDIGCGTGNFARPLAEAGFQVTLADFSAEMVRRAAAKLDGTFVVADGQQLPFCDAAFDCAISVNVLGIYRSGGGRSRRRGESCAMARSSSRCRRGRR